MAYEFGQINDVNPAEVCVEERALEYAEGFISTVSELDAQFFELREALVHNVASMLTAVSVFLFMAEEGTHYAIHLDCEVDEAKNAILVWGQKKANGVFSSAHWVDRDQLPRFVSK